LKGIDDAFWKAAKEAKPYLFGDQRSSSNNNPPPKAGDPPVFDAKTATPEEYQKKKAELIK